MQQPRFFGIGVWASGGCQFHDDGAAYHPDGAVVRIAGHFLNLGKSGKGSWVGCGRGKATAKVYKLLPGVADADRRGIKPKRGKGQVRIPCDLVEGAVAKGGGGSDIGNGGGGGLAGGAANLGDHHSKILLGAFLHQSGFFIGGVVNTQTENAKNGHQTKDELLNNRLSGDFALVCQQ